MGSGMWWQQKQKRPSLTKFVLQPLRLLSKSRVWKQTASVWLHGLAWQMKVPNLQTNAIKRPLLKIFKSSRWLQEGCNSYEKKKNTKKQNNSYYSSKRVRRMLLVNHWQSQSLERPGRKTSKPFSSTPNTKRSRETGSRVTRRKQYLTDIWSLPLKRAVILSKGRAMDII